MMRRAVFPALFSLSLVAWANAVEDGALAKCAIVSGDLDRLSCFDNLMREANLDGPQPQIVETSGTGKWEIERDVNPIDDSERVILFLTADEGRSRWGDNITFIARCQSNTTEAYINWNDYLGNDSTSVYSDWKRVTIRVGADKAVEQRWGLSTDSKATFAPDWAGDLLKHMAQSNTFIAQTTPYGESPVTAVFDTTGMADALVPLMEVCGWQMGTK